MRDSSEVGLLWNILSDEPVGVLHCSFLPRRVGVCEVNGAFLLPGDSLMRRELGPVVGRDSSRPESRGLDQAYHSLGVGITPYLARDGAHAYPDSLRNKN